MEKWPDYLKGISPTVTYRYEIKKCSLARQKQAGKSRYKDELERLDGKISNYNLNKGMDSSEYLSLILTEYTIYQKIFHKSQEAKDKLNNRLGKMTEEFWLFSPGQKYQKDQLREEIMGTM